MTLYFSKILRLSCTASISGFNSLDTRFTRLIISFLASSKVFPSLESRYKSAVQYCAHTLTLNFPNQVPHEIVSRFFHAGIHSR